MMTTMLAVQSRYATVAALGFSEGNHDAKTANDRDSPAFASRRRFLTVFLRRRTGLPKRELEIALKYSAARRSSS